MTDFWKGLEGQTVDGVFPLDEFLGGDEAQGMFTTREGLGAPRTAAIKLKLAAGIDVDSQLMLWERASKLSHPNLMRLRRWGRSEVRGTPMIYVITERSQETLAEVLLERPLEPAEAGKVLEPIANALAYLHDRGYVHTRVRPANLCAIVGPEGDVVKLTSDDIVPLLEAAALRKAATAYDAPEIAAGSVAPASDIWSFGWTVMEALTCQRPGKGSEAGELPKPFESVVQHSLLLEPSMRWNAQQIAACLRGELTDARPNPLKRYAIIAAAAILLLAAIWFWPRSSKPRGAASGEREDPRAPAYAQTAVAKAMPKGDRPSPMPARSPPDVPSPASRPSPQVRAQVTGDVVHRVMPQAREQDLSTISGSFDISIRVDIDKRGNVSSAHLESRGPSRYFADLCIKAARKWKFQPGEDDRQRIIDFEFTSAGVRVTAVR